MLRNGRHPRAPVAAPTAARMTRQEPGSNQKDHEEKSKHPEAKARRPWPVFRQGAAQQQSSGEADCLRAHRNQGRTLRTFRARELQNRSGRRARRQADADAHQGTSREYPPHVRCDRKQQSARQRSKEAGQHRRAATNLIGDAAEADQHDNDANRIHSEDSRRHRMGEVPFLSIKPVCQCRRRTCPKRVANHARRNQQARTAPEDEPPSHRRLSPVRRGTANGRRRYLDHRCRPCEFGKVSGVRTRFSPISGRSRAMRRRARLSPSSLTGLLLKRNYEAVLPPLTLMIWPVMNDALGEATNTMASAISAGVPTRLRGTPATSPAFLSAVPVNRFSIPVSTDPGATALTRMPDAAASSAAD